MGTIKSLPCYVATPTAPTSRGVIMFADMFGVQTGRHKQFCDMLAEKGYLTVCPDFISDNPYTSCTPRFGTTSCCVVEFVCLILTGAFDRKTKTFGWDVYMKQKVMGEIVPWMKEKGVTSFAAIGFCWGTYGAMKCSAYPEFKCAAGFHPSNEGFCKATGEDDIQVCREIKCPQLMIASKMESDRWKPDGEAHKACQVALPGKVKWEVEAEQGHGYMTRGDTTKPENMEAVKRGWDSMLALFKDSL